MSNVEQEIYQLLSQSFMRLDGGDTLLMRKFGLTLTQSWALVHLGNPEGRSLSELAHLLICDKSNVTSIADKLEAEGLATRQRGKSGDRRYTRVVLTEQGHRLRQAVIAARADMVRERLSALDTLELQQLHSSVQKLAEVLTEQYAHREEQRIVERIFERHTIHSEASRIIATET
jgi:MarR family transcriptional regulator, organic hydroperoxide resistance regulator